MNCYEFMYSLNIEIKVSISVEDPYPPCSGDAVAILGEDGTRRERMCNRSSRLHRLGPFCKRFELSFINFDSSGLTSGVFGLLGPFSQPRPWDEDDPFYPRAVAVWDAQPFYKRSQLFYLNYGNISAIGGFPSFEDGNVGLIYTDAPIGKAFLSIKKL